jgi:AraC-like DNA-binding protein
MREPTVAASWPRSLLDFAEARGADRDEMMRRSAIQPGDLADSNDRVPLEKYVALLDAAIDLSGNSALALEYGEHVPMDDLSIVPLVATGAATAGDVSEKVNRYSALMLDDGEERKPAEFVQRDGKLWIKLTSWVYAAHPAVTESAVARTVCGARRMLSSFGGGGILKQFPLEIHFTFPEPSHRNEYDRLFGVPLVFDSDMNAIAVDPAILSMPMPKPFGAAAAVATEKAEELLTRLESDRPTRSAVEKALTKGFSSGDIRMETIARQMGLSRSTLFRKLKEEGVTFDEVLSALRHRRALQLLNDEKRSVQQAAHLLGFSDPAAFSRAFKRWTGVSPSQTPRRESSRGR